MEFQWGYMGLWCEYDAVIMKWYVKLYDYMSSLIKQLTSRWQRVNLTWWTQTLVVFDMLYFESNSTVYNFTHHLQPHLAKEHACISEHVPSHLTLPKHEGTNTVCHLATACLMQLDDISSNRTVCTRVLHGISPSWNLSLKPAEQLSTSPSTRDVKRKKKWGGVVYTRWMAKGPHPSRLESTRTNKTIITRQGTLKNLSWPFSASSWW